MSKDSYRTTSRASELGLVEKSYLGWRLDPTAVLPYCVSMSEELSKRIDDLHKRFDDLRADMNQRFDSLRADMNQRFDNMNQRFADMGARVGDTNKRIDDLRGDMNQRLIDLNGTLRTFMWVVSGWFTFLTAVLAVFGFLRK